MKAEGWEFASHTWGHQNVGQISLEKLQEDTEKFKKNVDPLIGGTDIIIFAFGTDITTEPEYSVDKFEYLKGQGYNYFRPDLPGGFHNSHLYGIPGFRYIR